MHIDLNIGGRTKLAFLMRDIVTGGLEHTADQKDVHICDPNAGLDDDTQSPKLESLITLNTIDVPQDKGLSSKTECVCCYNLDSSSQCRAMKLSVGQCCANLRSTETGEEQPAARSLPTTNLWKRVRRRFFLLVCCRGPSEPTRNDELRPTIIESLEVAIMGSALIITAGLQLQEVVSGRGGYDPKIVRPYAHLIFIVASSLSFALSFYSIVIASVLLLTASSYSQRYVNKFTLLRQRDKTPLVLRRLGHHRPHVPTE